MSLKQRITDDMKAAMKAKEKERLNTVRLILAAIKQQEVDKQAELDDAAIIAVLDKMVKQRKDSITQYEDAGRDELALIEKQELDIIQVYLPQALTADEVNALLETAIAESGASSMQDMGKVMGILKPQVQGRTDMGQLSALVKARLV
jgi:uncharacterized protein YqeY